MATLEVQQKVVCPECAQIATEHIQQVSALEGLSWWTRISCPMCQTVAEDGGDGYPPEDIRQRLMQAHGIWGLKIPRQQDRHRALVCLRRTLDFSLQERVCH
ncbi:MAG: hypothetical protein AAFV53_13800 [Myxococcota bacterium]